MKTQKRGIEDVHHKPSSAKMSSGMKNLSITLTSSRNSHSVRPKVLVRARILCKDAKLTKSRDIKLFRIILVVSSPKES